MFSLCIAYALPMHCLCIACVKPNQNQSNCHMGYTSASIESLSKSNFIHLINKINYLNTNLHFKLLFALTILEKLKIPELKFRKLI